jgi:hypothetical protein
VTTTAIQSVHDLIGQLEAERDLIEQRLQRLRIAAELLDTFDPTDPVNELVIPLEDEPVTFVHTPPAPAPKPKPKAKPPGDRVPCLECGELFARQGLGPHRSRKHPATFGSPTVDTQPAASAATDDPTPPVRLLARAGLGERDPRDTFTDEFYACMILTEVEAQAIIGVLRHARGHCPSPAALNEAIALLDLAAGRIPCSCEQSDAYRQLDRSCPKHGDAAEARRRQGDA